MRLTVIPSVENILANCYVRIIAELIKTAFLLFVH